MKCVSVWRERQEKESLEKEKREREEEDRKRAEEGRKAAEQKMKLINGKWSVSVFGEKDKKRKDWRRRREKEKR